ncbi:hypothetical protein BJP34_13930 [Moorena producens PAL-8-15-08-1]|uniref:Uncharacterized protein n=2 Tax=Moorena TaxID=1155738 RepID=A0A1D8U3N5_9CYAN|nr:hypothetical protein BJP34_13930 [Moorena producens PAL-8-15-08-1]
MPAHAADIRNVLYLDNNSSSTAVLINKEHALDLGVVVQPGQKDSTGEMWTPWCDSQRDLGDNHYLQLTMKGGLLGEDCVYQIFQSGDYVWVTQDVDFSQKEHVGGDYNSGKGEYTLIVEDDSTEDNCPFYIEYDKI